MLISDQLSNQEIPKIYLSEEELLNIHNLAVECKNIENTKNVFSIFPLFYDQVNLKLIPKLYSLENIYDETILLISQEYVNDCIYIMTFGGIYIKYNQFLSYSMINNRSNIISQDLQNAINKFLSEKSTIPTSIFRSGKFYKNNIPVLFLQKYTHYGVLGFQKINNIYPTGIECDLTTPYIQQLKNYWGWLNSIENSNLINNIDQTNDFSLLY